MQTPEKSKPLNRQIREAVARVQKISGAPEAVSTLIWELKAGHVPSVDLDNSHSLEHLLSLEIPAFHLMDILQMKPDHREAVQRAIGCHDLGYRLCRYGMLELDDHHLGGTYIAHRAYANPEVTNAVFLHVRDVLPRGSSLITRLVRDVDRLGALGIYGLVREAFYKDFAPKWNHNLPGTDDFYHDPEMAKLMVKATAKHYFSEQLRGFFEAKGLCLELAAKARMLLDRFYGVRGFDGQWEIEPVMPVVQAEYNYLAELLVGFHNELIESHSTLFPGKYEIAKNLSERGLWVALRKGQPYARQSVLQIT